MTYRAAAYSSIKCSGRIEGTLHYHHLCHINTSFQSVDFVERQLRLFSHTDVTTITLLIPDSDGLEVSTVHSSQTLEHIV